MYDVNGKRVTIQDSVPEISQYSKATIRTSSSEGRVLIANHRAVHESQMAIEREYERQRKLEEFKRKTKQAAKKYSEIVNQETQQKDEQNKMNNELKAKKAKEFEEKVKQIRDTMTLKPKLNNNDRNKQKQFSSDKCRRTVPVKVHGPNANVNSKNNKENKKTQNKIYQNSQTRRPFGSTTINWGATLVDIKENKPKFPTYLPITDWKNTNQKVICKETGKPALNGNKKGSKLQQITATSIAVPMTVSENQPIIDKSTSIAISIDKNNFEFSSNGNSKLSRPLRESELLNYNKNNETIKAEYDNRQLEIMRQSQEKRLPLSKISFENSHAAQEQFVNPEMYSQFLSSIHEMPEQYGNPFRGKNSDLNQNYDLIEEEPLPKQSIPMPITLSTNYREARNQKKWSKVNNDMYLEGLQFN